MYGTLRGETASAKSEVSSTRAMASSTTVINTAGRWCRFVGRLSLSGGAPVGQVAGTHLLSQVLTTTALTNSSTVPVTPVAFPVVAVATREGVTWMGQCSRTMSRKPSLGEITYI